MTGNDPYKQDSYGHALSEMTKSGFPRFNGHWRDPFTNA